MGECLINTITAAIDATVNPRTRIRVERTAWRGITGRGTSRIGHARTVMRTIHGTAVWTGNPSQEATLKRPSSKTNANTSAIVAIGIVLLRPGDSTGRVAKTAQIPSE